MSAYVVNNETITVIANAIVEYGIEVPVEFDAMQTIFVNERIKPIGQWLLQQNYDSVNYRYNEEEKCPEFKPEDVEYNVGDLLGCIKCFEYQSCEVPGYEDSELKRVLYELRMEMLERLITQRFEIGWEFRK